MRKLKTNVYTKLVPLNGAVRVEVLTQREYNENYEHNVWWSRVRDYLNKKLVHNFKIKK